VVRATGPDITVCASDGKRSPGHHTLLALGEVTLARSTASPGPRRPD
jgi:hypothetical protein